MNINGTGSSTSNSDYSRITGLATGMDTDAMVKNAVAGDRMKINQAKQSEQLIEWQQEAYVGVIKDLKDFYSSYLDVLAPSETNMMTSSAYSGLKAESSDVNKIAVNAYGGALKGIYSVKINQLSEGAKVQSNTLAGATLTSKLSDLGLDITSGEMKLTVKGKEFTINVDPNKTIGEFISDVRNSKNGSDVLGNYINITFSELTKKITVEGKDTGATESINISDANGGNLATKLNILGAYVGKNAIVEITPPGEAVGISVEKSTNNFTIDNINYNLVAGSPGDTVSINVKPDATDKVEKFKKFIDKYNSLVESISSKLNEKKDYNYKPLTDDQKATMKDDEIKRWETKAKQGLLSRDSNLSNLLLQVRQAFYSTVEGAGLTAQDIGIETTSNWRDGGKLQLNESKLKAALETKGDQVQKLFTQSSDISTEKGIFQRIKDSFNQYVGSEGVLVKKAGYINTRWAGDNDLSKSIEKKKAAIAELETKIKTKQERYYSMFAALEKNMNKLNAQSSWLTSQLGG